MEKIKSKIESSDKEKLYRIVSSLPFKTLWIGKPLIVQETFKTRSSRGITKHYQITSLYIEDEVLFVAYYAYGFVYCGRVKDYSNVFISQITKGIEVHTQEKELLEVVTNE